jgi:hypothetical protein
MAANDKWIGGAVLIAIGGLLLLGQLVGDIEQYVVLAIGLFLLLLFAISRNPGTLIGGGIVTGLGVGVLIAASTEGEIAGAAVLFGLAVGFVAVWLIGTLMHVKGITYWPLIPGVILAMVGAVVLAGTEVAEQYQMLWPIGLIVLGVIVLFAARQTRGSGSKPETDEPTQAEPSTPDHVQI